MAWQPIETAPKDGTVILVYGVFAGEINGPDDGRTRGTAYWAGGSTDYPGYEWVACQTDAYAGWYKPSHWMPLPEPPK